MPGFHLTARRITFILMRNMQVYQHRAGLVRTLEAIKSKRLTIGFIGGSITDPRPGNNWPEPIVAWFEEHYPDVRLTIENAALGATGSELAVWRVKPDLIDRGCDLVFMEFAVNDNGCPTEQRNRTREGCIRQLLAGRGCDLIFTYTFVQDFYLDMISDRAPASIAEFETLAEHYGIGSVWMSLHALNEVRSGKMRWEDWLPDGLHPQNRGSLSYAQAVQEYLGVELLESRNALQFKAGNERPRPLDARNWEAAARVPWTAIRTTGPWALRRWQGCPFMDYVLDTAAVGATLGFNFRGRVLTLGFDFGKTSSEFRYRLDGGDWKTVQRDRPDWVGPSGWFRVITLLEEAASTDHTFEMEVTHGNAAGCTGTNCRLGLVGIVT